MNSNLSKWEKSLGKLNFNAFFQEYIGYAPNEILDLIEEFSEKMVLSFSNMKMQWNNLQSVIRKNWIGPDERSYEKELFGALKKLYDDNLRLFGKCIRNIFKIAIMWHNFQDGNLVIGEDKEFFLINSDWSIIYDRYELLSKLDDISIGDTLLKGNSKMREANGKNIFDLSNISDWNSRENISGKRGIVNDNSATIIHNAISMFINNINSYTNMLLNSFNINIGFYGNYNTYMSILIYRTISYINGVNRLVSKYDEMIDVLITKKYEEIDSEISQDIKGILNKTENDNEVDL